jgi:hypothetical protein
MAAFFCCVASGTSGLKLALNLRELLELHLQPT